MLLKCGRRTGLFSGTVAGTVLAAGPNRIIGLRSQIVQDVSIKVSNSTAGFDVVGPHRSLTKRNGKMGGIEDLMAESNDRWAQATKRAQGLADRGLGEAVKTYYTRFWPGGVFVLVVIGSVVAALAFGGSLGDWPSYLAFGFMLAGLGTMIGGLVFNSKKVVPAADYGNVDVTLSLTSEERKHVRRQIAGKTTVVPGHLTVTRGAAVQMRKALATQLLIMPFYPLVFIPQALNSAGRDDPFGWVFLVAVFLLMIGMIFVVRDFSRAGRFLGRTAGQPSGMR
jgi:hypothetical protein